MGGGVFGRRLVCGCRGLLGVSKELEAWPQLEGKFGHNWGVTLNIAGGCGTYLEGIVSGELYGDGIGGWWGHLRWGLLQGLPQPGVGRGLGRER